MLGRENQMATLCFTWCDEVGPQTRTRLCIMPAVDNLVKLYFSIAYIAMTKYS